MPPSATFHLDAMLHPVLLAAIDRIIPADEFPSASHAGVDVYILRLLNGDLREQATAFRQGLLALDREAAARFDAPFAKIDQNQQDQILQAFQRGAPHSAFENSPRFFSQLVELAMEGYYSDPGNGGNRDAVSWKMVGYQPRAQLRKPS